jgi:hypothetical protein
MRRHARGIVDTPRRTEQPRGDRRDRVGVVPGGRRSPQRVLEVLRPAVAGGGDRGPGGPQRVDDPAVVRGVGGPGVLRLLDEPLPASRGIGGEFA